MNTTIYRNRPGETYSYFTLPMYLILSAVLRDFYNSFVSLDAGFAFECDFFLDLGEHFL